MEIGTKFNITYFAKKYGKFITRAGLWTEQSKDFFSKKNIRCFTYFDTDANNYRTATDAITIERKE